jgi:predicted DNA-binding protein
MNAITTARLPAGTRSKLLALARIKGKTKSDIIKESVDRYYEQEEKEIDSYTLGLSFFGNYASGDRDRGLACKRRVKEKLRAQFRAD